MKFSIWQTFGSCLNIKKYWIEKIVRVQFYIKFSIIELASNISCLKINGIGYYLIKQYIDSNQNKFEYWANCKIIFFKKIIELDALNKIYYQTIL